MHLMSETQRTTIARLEERLERPLLALHPLPGVPGEQLPALRRGQQRQGGERLLWARDHGFQEEREAAAKWVRVQLTSTQLATYFVGFQEHLALREEARQRWGAAFTLKRYHDTALAFGSPPVRYVRELMFDLPIR